MAISYIGQLELVDDTVDYEYRTHTIALVSRNVIIIREPQRRRIRTKIYEAVVEEDPNNLSLPAPEYVAGLNMPEPNPENLSPVGSGLNCWHLEKVQYTKTLSEPLSPRLQAIWVYRYDWQSMDESESV